MLTQFFVRAMRPSFKGVLLATVATLAAGAGVSVASAQQAPSDAEADDALSLDTVVVTGFRDSLRDAREIKRESVVLRDVIVAENMAKFPELNLAESLQRLPGVQINREAGEGRRISLRGLGPDFARVQLNGMEVLGNVDSAQDSRGQRSRDRAFDFNIFASELFSRVEVEKTYEAAQKEGGMAGTVGLFTAKPFDYDAGGRGALTARMGTNEYTKDNQPRIAAMYSYNWNDQFGALFSAAYSKRKTTEQGHNTYNFVRTTAENWQRMVDAGLDISGLSAEQQDKFLSGDLYYADGNRISSWNSDMERLGLTGAFQWRPADNLVLTLDAMYGEFTTNRSEMHLATRPLSSVGSVSFDTPAGGVWPDIFQTASTLNDLRWDSSDYVTLTDVTGTTFGSENRRSRNENQFTQILLSADWEATDKLSIDGHVGYQRSTYDTPYDDKLYMRAKGNQIADYGPDGRSASFQFPNWDPTDTSTYAMDDFYYRGFNNQSELQEVELNVNYDFNPTWMLRSGLAYHRFQQEGADFFYDGDVNGTREKMRGTSAADVAKVFKNSFGTWLVGDYDRAFAKYNEYHRFEPNVDGAGGEMYDIENVYDTEEVTFSGYVQADWESELFGRSFRGNIGLRGYSTDTSSTGWIQGGNYVHLGESTVEGSYSGILPAMNMVLEVTPELQVRFAASQNLNRPGLGSIAARGSAFLNSDTGEITASRGNPDLKPYKDETLDFSLEYYFGEMGVISGSVFQKNITNYIGSVMLENVPFSETGIPHTTVQGATPDTLVTEFTMPVNIDGTNTLRGLELVAQMQFTFLPAPFDNFGIVTNYTTVDADQNLIGVSKVSYNGTLYYETDFWGVRGSLSHRDSWFTGHNTTVMNAGTRGFDGSTYVDAAAFINVRENLQLTFDAINLTNEKDTQFWGQNQYLYNQNQSGTTYMVGLSYSF